MERNILLLTLACCAGLGSPAAAQTRSLCPDWDGTGKCERAEASPPPDVKAPGASDSPRPPPGDSERREPEAPRQSNPPPEKPRTPERPRTPEKLPPLHIPVNPR